jgi:hypothetical protein
MPCVGQRSQRVTVGNTTIYVLIRPHESGHLSWAQDTLEPSRMVVIPSRFPPRRGLRPDLLGVEVLHYESRAVKQFVERDYLRTMRMTAVELERSVLFDVDAAV